MLRVPTNNIRPGMRLASEVLHPERGIVLLRWGFQLEQSIIEKLKELRIREVWVQYPGTNEIRNFISPAIMKKRGEVVSLIAELFGQIHRNAQVKLDFEDFDRVFNELVDAIVADPTASAYIIEMGGYAQNELRHSADVSFLSLLLGIKLQSYLINQRKRLSPKLAKNVGCLALGAMLHDIGYMLIDKEIVDRYNQSGDQSDAQWRAHVKAGYELINGSVRPAAAGVVVQHHQHYDGSGFPTIVDEHGIERGLRGEEIHVFARIVSVTDQFDRLLHPGDGSSPPRVRVLRQMLTKPLANRFDPIVLGALPLVVPAYSPGSIVRLSNGEQVVVVRWHPEQPCRPLVQPLPEDVLDRPVPEDAQPAATYDLRERTDLIIVEQDGHDVSRDNFTLAPGRLQKWVSQSASPPIGQTTESEGTSDGVSEAA